MTFPVFAENTKILKKFSTFDHKPGLRKIRNFEKYTKNWKIFNFDKIIVCRFLCKSDTKRTLKITHLVIFLFGIFLWVIQRKSLFWNRSIRSIMEWYGKKLDFGVRTWYFFKSLLSWLKWGRSYSDRSNADRFIC